MSGSSTAVPTLVFGDTGFVQPAESDILAGVQSDINEAFDGGLNPGLSTPQGQIASTTTAIIGNNNDQWAWLFNSVDPSYASGRMQDAIGRIYFIERIPAQATVVAATCSGLTGVTIPTGALAKAVDGNLYVCVTGGIIPAGGSVVLQFACAKTGPIACASGSLNTIYQTVSGWDSITNAADGVLGNDVESRNDFEKRRSASVAKNAVGTNPAILAAVLDVTGVVDAYVIDNSLPSAAVIGGVSLAAKSLYVAIVGGADQDVGNAIWTKKPPGCGYNGNTTVTVVDNSSGYSLPYPSYSVTFQRPTSVAISFAGTLGAGTDVPSTAAAQVQAAIISAFAGSDGGQRARIGSTIYASRFYSAVAALGPWVRIVNILIGSGTATATSLTLRIDQVPSVAASNISVALA